MLDDEWISRTHPDISDVLRCKLISCSNVKTNPKLDLCLLDRGKSAESYQSSVAMATPRILKSSRPPPPRLWLNCNANLRRDGGLVTPRRKGHRRKYVDQSLPSCGRPSDLSFERQTAIPILLWSCRKRRLTRTPPLFRLNMRTAHPGSPPHPHPHTHMAYTITFVRSKLSFVFTEV